MAETGGDRARTDLVVRPATESECDVIASVVRRAFSTVAEEMGVDIPPLHETAEDVLATFSAGDAALVAEAGGTVVGTVRGETMDGGDVMVRRLAVLPEWRGSGIARALMQALEGRYPGARRFELFTAVSASGPLALYESLGYRRMTSRQVEPEWMVSLEKRLD